MLMDFVNLILNIHMESHNQSLDKNNNDKMFYL